ncbi:hypothetical protein MtrunA17_Chr5g0402131 [Medicago truncatula]|uniref:Uncharacterized protein n=1 Tax=Medicago truncatula TaxID=3880 RepID=A0A396HN77_MEDTR|nr:hypothetical protein MtrunA17_Chr5g0402131 [Medicago truncatula]
MNPNLFLLSNHLTVSINFDLLMILTQTLKCKATTNSLYLSSKAKFHDKIFVRE